MKRRTFLKSVGSAALLACFAPFGLFRTRKKQGSVISCCGRIYEVGEGKQYQTCQAARSAMPKNLRKWGVQTVHIYA